jgi:hypothetical protein
MKKRKGFFAALLFLPLVIAACSKVPVERTAPALAELEQDGAGVERQSASSENVVVNSPPIAPRRKILPRRTPIEVPLPVTPVSPTDGLPSPQSTTATRIVTIPAGTTIAVRTIESIDSRTDHVGQTYRAAIDTPVTVKGEVVIPRGADARLTLNRVMSAGDFRGKSELQIELGLIVVGKKEYAISSNVIDRSGEPEGPKTAAEVGAGATIGAAVGGISGGGKGAAIGAGVGAASGVIIAAATRGEQVIVASETCLDFRLEQPLDVEIPEPAPAPGIPTDRITTSGPRRLGEAPITLDNKDDYRAIDLSGQWKLFVEEPQERRALELFLEQDGNTLLGRIVDPLHGEIRLHGSVSGRSVKFSTQTDIPGATARSEYKGTLSGSRLRGTVVIRVSEWTTIPIPKRGRLPPRERVVNWSAQRVKR